jgi:hypothetical protein
MSGVSGCHDASSSSFVKSRAEVNREELVAFQPVASLVGQEVFIGKL